MIKLDATVILSGGVREAVVAGPVDLVAFENVFDRSLAKFSNEMKLGDIFWIAHHALHRLGRTGLGFEEWLAGVEDIEVSEGEIPPSATPPFTG